MAWRPWLAGAELLIADTNMHAALHDAGPRGILLGPDIARGLGTGGRLAFGLRAAQASSAALEAALAGTGLLLIVAGLGGGTGGGASPWIERNP